MSDFVTLDRKNPEFEKYLWGNFSKDQRALPVKSLNVHSDQETVTFRLVPKNQISRPSWLIVLIKLLRPRAFLQILIPMFLTFSLALRQEGALDPDLPWVATLGLLFLFAALLLANDVQDHLSGADRIREDRGSRALQKGWVTATSLWRISQVFMFLAFVLGLVVVVVVPFVAVVLLPAAALGLWVFYRSRRSYQDLAVGPWSLAVLGGPFLTVGYHAALTASFNLQVLVLGVLWAWWLLFPMHLRDLSQLVSEGRSHLSKTMVGRLGFDRSVRWIQIWWILGLSGLVVYQFLDQAPFWFWLILFLLVLSSVRFLKALLALKSPAGSEATFVRQQGEIYFWLVIAVWVMDAVWGMSA